MSKFGERLRELRTENACSRSTLATELNVSVRLIAYWENNQRECGLDTLISIADYFNTSTDYLLGRKDY